MVGRNTKIVATVGPSCWDPKILGEMYILGMDVARVNMSHGSDEEHRRAVRLVEEVREDAVVGRPLALMLDTRGPELRLEGLDSPVDIEAGERIFMAGKEDDVSKPPDDVTTLRAGIPRLTSRVPVGSRVLVDDGRVSLEVIGLEGGWLVASSENRAKILPGKGLAFPGVALSLPFMSDEDVRDIDLALEVEADWLALSFVQQASDVLGVRDYLGEKAPGLIAKIETLAGYRNLEGILQVVDGIMIGRGDLGVDCPPEEIPLMQKDIIRRCNRAGVPVITATQMLESMIESPVATRAEASDVANAILDGTDAVMLSGETAAGSYPREALATMARIVERTESGWKDRGSERRGDGFSSGVTDAVARSAVWIAEEVEAQAILTPTQSGHTAVMVSRYRPEVPVVAVTSSPRVCRRLALAWGVMPLLKESEGDVVEDAGEVALGAKCVSPGARVVITSGQPQGVPGTTNALQVRTLGKIVARGFGVGKGSARGDAWVIDATSDVPGKEFPSGGVLVIGSWRPEMGELAARAGGIIAEEPGLSSPAALAGLGFGIPVIVGVDGAPRLITPGTEIIVDARRGIVYSSKEIGTDKGPVDG